MIKILFTQRSAHSIREGHFKCPACSFLILKTVLESFYLSDCSIRNKLGCTGNSGTGRSKAGRGKAKISEQDKEEGVARERGAFLADRGETAASKDTRFVLS